MHRLPGFIPTASDERVVYFLRHHWITFIGPLAFNIVLALAPLAGAFLLAALIPTIFNPAIVQAVGVLGLSLYYFTLWLFTFNHFLEFYLDLWIVTNKRIIDIEQHSLWKRVVSEQPLSRVQDITSEVTGILPTMLGYGTIHVQTAGSGEKFVFKNIPHPEKISQSILAVIEREKAG